MHMAVMNYRFKSLGLYMNDELCGERKFAFLENKSTSTTCSFCFHVYYKLLYIEVHALLALFICGGLVVSCV